LTGRNGEALLRKSDFELLHRAVVARCDMNDGVKDGVIGDPRACRFDPSELQCTSTKSSNCLTTPQIEAVKTIYEGPVNSNGKNIARPIALRGSELDWSAMFGGSSAAPSALFNYVRDWFRYSIFPIDLGSEGKPEAVDIDRDYKRVGAMVALAPNHPDLRRFKACGGKLLAYTG
jgi:tannase/feruloyl esterase